jgi:hypothetical protein
MEHDAIDPLTEATELNDYRFGADGGCPASWNCGENLHTDADVIRHLMSHTPEELAWALLMESATVFRLHDYITFRKDLGREGPVPYGISETSPETDADTDEVQGSVAATAKRQLPPHVARSLGMDA